MVRLKWGKIQKKKTESLIAQRVGPWISSGGSMMGISTAKKPPKVHNKPSDKLSKSNNKGATFLYRIRKTSFGFRLTLDGAITVAELTQLKTELPAIFASIKKPFGVIDDIRNVVPFGPKVKTLLEELETMSREAGLERRAVVYKGPVMKGQASQISFLSKTDDLEMRIDASKAADWNDIALAWVVDGVGPSLTPSTDDGHGRSS